MTNPVVFTWDDADRLAELDGYAHRTRGQQAEYEELTARRDAARRHKEAMEQQFMAGLPARMTESVGSRAGYGTDYAAKFSRDLDGSTAPGPAGAVTRARRLVEAVHKRGEFPDRAASALDGLLIAPKLDERWRAAELVETLASDTYGRALERIIRDPQSGHLYLRPEERDALARGRALAIGSGATGGFAVPLQLDPSLMLTSDGVIDPVRRLARVEAGVAKEFDLVSTAGVSVSWAAEAEEATDDSPTLAQPAVKAIRMQCFVPFSIELDTSWSGAQAQLRRVMTDAADAEDARVHIAGTGGTSQPEGVVTALTGGASRSPRPPPTRSSSRPGEGAGRGAAPVHRHQPGRQTHPAQPRPSHSSRLSTAGS